MTEDNFEEENVEISDSVISPALNELRRTVIRKRQRYKRIRISLISSFMLLLVMVPVFIHFGSQSQNNTVYWKDMLISTVTNYEDLTKKEMNSIKELNEKNNGNFYWLDNATRTESYLLKQDDQIVGIEEHYLYENIDCVLYIMNQNSYIEMLNSIGSFEMKYNISYDLIINYTTRFNFCYARLRDSYSIILTIDSTDIPTLESIFSNLTCE